MTPHKCPVCGGAGEFYVFPDAYVTAVPLQSLVMLVVEQVSFGR